MQLRIFVGPIMLPITLKSLMSPAPSILNMNKIPRISIGTSRPHIQDPALMISSGIVCQRILYLLHYISVYFKTGKREPYYKSGMPLENFHFTVPIFLSALLYAGGVY